MSGWPTRSAQPAAGPAQPALDHDGAPRRGRGADAAMTGQTLRMPTVPMPGGLAAGQISAIAGAIRAQRSGIATMRANLDAYEQQLAVDGAADGAARGDDQVVGAGREADHGLTLAAPPDEVRKEPRRRTDPAVALHSARPRTPSTVLAPRRWGARCRDGVRGAAMGCAVPQRAAYRGRAGLPGAGGPTGGGRAYRGRAGLSGAGGPTGGRASPGARGWSPRPPRARRRS